MTDRPDAGTSALVDCVVEDVGWDALDLPALAERAAEAALDHLGLSVGEHEIALLACSDARIAELNAAFRGRDGPTNVLSWPARDLAPVMPGAAPAGLPRELGDIAIARETVLAEAAAAGRAPSDHVVHLIVHAVLHLLGHDHDRDRDAATMEGLEAAILERMGMDDPYSADRAAGGP